MTEVLLEIKNLGIQFSTGEGTVQPIREVNFSLKKVKLLGLLVNLAVEKVLLH